MTITIDTSGRLSIDHVQTGLALAQRREGTVIYTPEGVSTKYTEHKMPHARYSAAHDAPASGAAGRAQLEADILDLMKKL
ncbi:MAG: hypothetical protein V4451_16125 [Pseudomonadota bacterium]